MRWTLALAAAVMGALTPVAAEAQLKRKGDTLTLAAAGLRLPATAGALTLTTVDEMARKGDGLDNYARYDSPDRQVYATAYIYMAGIPDASLAAYATDRAIRQRFGADIRPTQQASVTFAGRPNAMIRSVYGSGAVEGGQPIFTAAAFATVGRWTVKLRASGPAAREAEVLAAFDALIAGIAVDKPDTVATTQPLAFDAPCPAAATRVAVKAGGDLDADALLGALVGAVPTSVTRPGETPASFPDQGRTRACVRGTIAIRNGTVDVIQPAGEATPHIQLAALSDSGNILAVQRSVIDDSYSIRAYSVGQVDTLGQLDGQPDVAQLQGWLAAPGAPALALRSRTVLDAKGKASIQLPGGMSVQPKRR